jgi:tetratricopeptide (TPR) repeat protein
MNLINVILSLSLISSFCLPILAADLPPKKVPTTAVAPVTSQPTVPANVAERELRMALQLYKSRDYAKAADLLFKVSKTKTGSAVRQQAQFFLGLSLYRLQLKQTAAFPLVQLVREGSPDYKRKALDILVAIADSLDESSLLDYSLSKVTPDQLSETALGVVYYRLGEISLKSGQTDKAIASFQSSMEQKGVLENSLYSLALAYLIKKEPDKAIPLFSQLVEKYEKKSVTDRKRGLAILGLARSYYQAHKWKEAVDAYRRIPKDHPFYRETLMELSWALFRSGRFRSALSPLQTLHTPYYSNFYDPESLLLHGIILLFSCRYSEVQPLIKSFDENYHPAIAKVQEWIQGARSAQDYFQELDKAYRTLSIMKKTGNLKTDSQIPFFIMRTILDETDLLREVRYLDRVRQEKALVAKILNTGTQKKLQAYSLKIIDGRIKAAKTRMAFRVQSHLKKKVDSFGEFADQFGFLKYETLNGLRTSLKSHIASGGDEQSVDSGRTRDFYIRNGFRFWPFQGEYWRDEMGSYQYVGVNSCESTK